MQEPEPDLLDSAWHCGAELVGGRRPSVRTRDAMKVHAALRLLLPAGHEANKSLPKMSPQAQARLTVTSAATLATWRLSCGADRPWSVLTAPVFKLISSETARSRRQLAGL
jgi:hypothetical protein